MSHKATMWAIAQRGLRPAAKLVLWHLCDRYHPDNGCFPSQETLAYDCELSRSSLNDQIAALEAAGLIRREQRRDEGTNRQQSTRYRFAFEDDFKIPDGNLENSSSVEDFTAGSANLQTRVENIPGENVFDLVPSKNEVAENVPAENNMGPCPNSGHGAVSENQAEPCPNLSPSRVRISDTNLVREPVREPIERERAQEDFEKARHAWPSGFADDRKTALDAWLALTADERCEAVAEIGRYVNSLKSIGRSHVPSFGRYLGDKSWLGLGPRVQRTEAACKPMQPAPPAPPTKAMLERPDLYADRIAAWEAWNASSGAAA
ncbi:helix-turn-helix domain-containing protein [Mesorhizobium sp. B4-1-1]|uniref:helix-turn-helix domain-containing protein n=1 Tax=Mesorhizobium sp. B4-1-1 TaxID=2589890 RepID=UPI00112ACEA1|nr:helix-turn-helix domain-containing protein [Mesorhizobium sp. B4-1-1]TPI16586.1 helix-turn-helix domain-containing protein [Mesorhizobium sp. B4-1-1]